MNGDTFTNHLSLYHLSLPHLSFSFDNPLVGGELFQCHGATGMQLLGADTNFSAQSELRSVCKGSRYVDVYAGGVHISTEPFGTGLIFGHDTFAMFGAIFLDMGDGFADGLNGFDGHLVVQEFGAEVLFCGFFQQLVGIAAFQGIVGIKVCIDYHMALGQRPAKGGEVAEAVSVNQYAVQSIADTDAAGFGIVDDGGTFLRVTISVEEGVADACAGFNDRDGGVLAYKVDEVAAAAGDEQIHVASGIQQFGGCFTVGGQQLYDMWKRSSTSCITLMMARLE